MLFNPDYKDMLLALSDAKIDFLLVGAYAVPAHGHPRATGDLDLWVRPNAETAPKVYQVIAEFGAHRHERSGSDFYRLQVTRLSSLVVVQPKLQKLVGWLEVQANRWNTNCH